MTKVFGVIDIVKYHLWGIGITINEVYLSCIGDVYWNRIC